MYFFTGTLAILLACIAQAAADVDDVDVGYRIIWSYPGPSIPQSLLDATRSGKVGGVIFYSENIDKAQDLPGQIRSLQDAYRESPRYYGFPLLLVTDQEGGQVNRLPGGPAKSAKAIGTTQNFIVPAQEAANNVADVFSQYGINGDLAPVLDVYREEGNFIDREQRSFNSNPATVGEIAGPWIETLQKRGYVATAKHFPGLGAAAAQENTDARPVTINTSADELRGTDMLPYHMAIKVGVQMIMTSWAIYPALDDGVPAGLSRKIVQEELRQKLGFEGVTITDALEAGSLKPFGDTGQLAVRACQAGMDIVLASVRQVAQGEAAHEAIVSALRNGTIDRGEFNAATERIKTLRKRL